ncbi:MAG: UDP-N-acetylmuramoyl-L-alanyl-D-glutamate--2,6-diaminopimelate ligase [Clostridia bacterium]|nr:UDP-N-acetylmuramoyl-L-alanyl-D-glutamate--2,6-diaminopimelate ligase [Clostridia bacterium]
MKLIELISGADIELVKKEAESNDLLDELEIFDISSDSRRVKNGSLFVCLKGTKSDGHRYIGDAIEKGAVAVIIEGDGDFDRSVFDEEGAPLLLKAENTRRALAFLWNTWFGHPGDGMKLVAVTGTNGKTSVTHMLRAIFSASLYITGLIGTVVCYSGENRLSIRSEDENANMTTPDPKELFEMLSVMKRDGASVVFIEATSHALALDKLAPLHFAAAVFTNLTPDHLDFHGSMENYLESKKKLFSMTDIAIINGDDAYGARIAEAAEKGGCRNIRICSADENFRGDYSAMNVTSLGTDGVEYILSSVCSVFKIRSPIPGRFTVMNTLEAAATALLLGIDCRNIQDALRHMGGIDGRFERVRLCAGAEFSVFIDYAHTPDALENLLKTARGFRREGQRIVLLFGCGGDRDKSKRSTMGRIASVLADFVIITSDNSRSEDPSDIISDITVGFDFTRAHAVIIENREEAIYYAIKNALKGDIILFAGKGHEEYEIDRSGKHPFSEKKIAREAAERYYGIGNSYSRRASEGI